MANSNIDERLRKAARLYCWGPPEVRGDWLASARAAGYSRVPTITRDNVQLAITQARAEEPDVPETVDEDVIVLGSLLEDPDPSWSDLARLAKRIIAKVAVGLLDQSPGQVQALKEIIARHEGRIGQNQEETKDIYVVVLPTFSTDSGPVIDMTDFEETQP